jgi:hypothetical protein
MEKKTQKFKDHMMHLSCRAAYRARHQDHPERQKYEQESTHLEHNEFLEEKYFLAVRDIISSCSEKHPDVAMSLIDVIQEYCNKVKAKPELMHLHNSAETLHKVVENKRKETYHKVEKCVMHKELLKSSIEDHHKIREKHLGYAVNDLHHINEGTKKAILKGHYFGIDDLVKLAEKEKSQELENLERNKDEILEEDVLLYSDFLKTENKPKNKPKNEDYPYSIN